MSLSLLFLATIIPLNLFIASIVLLRGFKLRSSQYFSVSVLFLCLWAFGDLLILGSRSETWLHIGYYLFYISPIYTTLFMVLFAISFKSIDKINRWLVGILTLTTLSLSFIISVNQNFLLQTITIDRTGDNQIVVQPVGWLVYILFYITLFSLSYIYLFKHYKKSRGNQRTQILYVALGIFLSSYAALITNLVLPLFGNTSFLWAGPVFSIFYAAATLYSIVKHRLFDINYVILRLFAYIVSLLIIISMFSLLLSFGLKTLLPFKNLDPLIQLYYALAMVFAALSFSPIKALIDRFTNKLFFQKHYSVQDAIDRISSFATKNVNPGHIENHALGVFGDTIRPEYAAFILFDKDSQLKLNARSNEAPHHSLMLDDFYEKLGMLHQKITVIEEDNTYTSRLAKYIELNHIGLIARLSTSNKTVGYLVFGLKRNGTSYSRNDIEFITIAANDLALALQNAQRYEEIQAFNATLQYKINDATKALKRTNEKLIALDDAKDDFISMASHQLRTPLTSIKGYLSMTLEGDLGKITPAQRQALKEAFDSSQRMVFLISDFLNVSRIRTGKFALEITETNLVELVKEEIGQLRDMAGLRGQKITFNPPANFPIARLDEMKTRQVMMNMIDNAIFYTPKDGAIEIVLEQTKTEIIFKVIDNGIGVPQADQHRLFTKFFRAPNAKNARPDGTGLGLFMAQKIIAAQGGKIIFQSVEGQGSTFGFRFPLSKVSLKNEH